MTELCHFFRDITSTSLVVEHMRQLEEDIPFNTLQVREDLTAEFL